MANMESAKHNEQTIQPGRPVRALALFRDAFQLERSFWIFLGASFLFSFGMFIFMLLYNLHLLARGFDEGFLGHVAGATTAGNIIGTLACVWLNRTIGLKATVLLFFAGLPLTLVLRVLVNGQWALLGLAFGTGLLFAIWAISITVVIAQVTSERLRPVGFSVYLAVCIGVGVIADPVGGHLPAWITAWSGASADQSRQWAMLAAAFVIALGFWPAWHLRLTRPAGEPPVTFPRGPFVMRFMFAVLLLNIATAAFNPFANAFFAQQLHLPAAQIGLVFSAGQLAQVVAILVSPLILRRLGLVGGIAAMEIAAGCSLALLAVSPAAGLATLGYAGYLAFQWMDEPAMESLLMAKVQPHERSGAAAMMYMTIFGAGAVTSPLAGHAITRFGYPTTMVSAAAFLLLGGTLFGLLLGKIERAETPPARSGERIPGPSYDAG